MLGSTENCAEPRSSRKKCIDEARRGGAIQCEVGCHSHAYLFIWRRLRLETDWSPLQSLGGPLSPGEQSFPSALQPLLLLPDLQLASLETGAQRCPGWQKTEAPGWCEAGGRSGNKSRGYFVESSAPLRNSFCRSLIWLGFDACRSRLKGCDKAFTEKVHCMQSYIWRYKWRATAARLPGNGLEVGIQWDEDSPITFR